MIQFTVFVFSLFFLNSHHLGLNFLLNLLIRNKKFKLLQILMGKEGCPFFAPQPVVYWAGMWRVSKVLSLFKGSCLVLQGGWVWTWLDVEPVSPFPMARNSLVNKFFLMYADRSELCSTAKPQGYSWALLGDKAPSIYVADPSGLVLGYFLNGRQAGCLSATLDSGWVTSAVVAVLKTEAAAGLGLACVIY